MCLVITIRLEKVSVNKSKESSEISFPVYCFSKHKNLLMAIELYASQLQSGKMTDSRLHYRLIIMRSS